MKVSIIGSNSLLASYIAENLLEKGYFLNLFGKSTLLSGAGSPNVHFVNFSYPEHDINLEQLNDSDAVIYCAAAGVQAGKTADPYLTYEINSFLPIRILNYLDQIDFKGKWISFGSYFEIGDNSELKFFSENEVINSLDSIPNHYCSSKRLFTRFMSNRTFNTMSWHFILPTIFGAKENKHRLIPYIIDALKNDEPLKLSSGNQIRQYLHCSDVVRLLTMILECNYRGGIYNVSGSDSIKIADLVKTVFAFFGKNAEPFLGTLNTRDESMKVLLLDNTKIKKEISDWKPLITLEEGIHQYI